MVKLKILHISPDFNYSCGVSKNVFDSLKHFNKREEYNVHFITNGGDALSKLDKHNIEYGLFHFSKGWTNIFYLPFNYFQLKSFCAENKIDIIHTHHRYPELLSTLVAKRINIKTITTTHSLVRGYKYLSFKSDKIIAVSNTVKKTIIKNFAVPAEKIESIYNCIYPWEERDTNGVQKLREKLNIKKTEYVILFLGRINRIKGIDILINAFKELRKTHLLINLILVGSFEDRAFRSFNIRQNEKICLVQAQEDITSFYELSNVVVLPSRVDPFPYTMLEAGYFKKPFIGSRTGGIAEFIEEGVNGFLFEPGNADDLADKIKFVINNPEIANSAAEQLNKKVKKYCNCEYYFEKLTNIYHSLLENDFMTNKD